jgi:hypothetical protein
MSEFSEWRAALKLTQFEARQALGLSRRMVFYYEAGEWPIPEKVRFAMAHLAEHPSKLKDARAAPLPATDIQRAALAKLADGAPHKLNRKTGEALARRKLARELASGFVITDAGRSIARS